MRSPLVYPCFRRRPFFSFLPSARVRDFSLQNPVFFFGLTRFYPWTSPRLPILWVPLRPCQRGMTKRLCHCDFFLCETPATGVSFSSKQTCSTGFRPFPPIGTGPTVTWPFHGFTRRAATAFHPLIFECYVFFGKTRLSSFWPDRVQALSDRAFGLSQRVCVKSASQPLHHPAAFDLAPLFHGWFFRVADLTG